MLTNALLLKIGIALAAILALLGIWYNDSRRDALERVRIEQQWHHQPTQAQRDEASRRAREEMTNEGYQRARKHPLDSLGGKQ